MPQLALGPQPFVDLILEIGGIGEEKRSVEADEVDVDALLQPVNQGGSQGVVAMARQAHDRGPHALIQKNSKRQNHTDHDASIEVRRKDQRTDEGHDRNDPVIPLRSPGMHETADIDQADDGHHDHGGENRLWEVVEQRREEEQHDDDREARDDAGQPGESSGLEIDRTSGKAAGRRVALAHRAKDIGDPLADKLLVGVDALPGLGSHRFGDGDGLHKAEEGDDHCRDDQPWDDPHVDVRQARGRQATGDGADDRTTSHQQQAVGVEEIVADFQTPAPMVGRRPLRCLVLLIETSSAVAIGNASEHEGA